METTLDIAANLLPADYVAEINKTEGNNFHGEDIVPDVDVEIEYTPGDIEEETRANPEHIIDPEILNVWCDGNLITIDQTPEITVMLWENQKENKYDG
jgi:hypothetical protein